MISFSYRLYDAVRRIYIWLSFRHLSRIHREAENNPRSVKCFTPAYRTIEAFADTDLSQRELFDKIKRSGVPEWAAFEYADAVGRERKSQGNLQAILMNYISNDHGLDRNEPIQ